MKETHRKDLHVALDYLREYKKRHKGEYREHYLVIAKDVNSDGHLLRSVHTYKYEYEIIPVARRYNTLAFFIQLRCGKIIMNGVRTSGRAPQNRTNLHGKGLL